MLPLFSFEQKDCRTCLAGSASSSVESDGISTITRLLLVLVPSSCANNPHRTILSRHEAGFIASSDKLLSHQRKWLVAATTASSVPLVQFIQSHFDRLEPTKLLNDVDVGPFRRGCLRSNSLLLDEMPVVGHERAP